MRIGRVLIASAGRQGNQYLMHLPDKLRCACGNNEGNSVLIGKLPGNVSPAKQGAHTDPLRSPVFRCLQAPEIFKKMVGDERLELPTSSV